MPLTEPLRASLADRYAVGEEIGRGGMSLVFRGRDLRNQRDVAIKVLRPELSVLLGSQRFLREIDIARRLQHPHILPLYDSGDAGGILYYVMPYVPGETLRDRIARERQLPLDDSIQIAREVAQALRYAHDQGVVHRDIKPENILLWEGHAIVVDFGIARAVTVAGGQELTTSGVAIGTPAYMSPEQGGGSQDVDPRSDIYSLGCVLYEMLVGEPPFTGPTAQAVIARHALERVPSLSVVRPTLPVGLQAVIEKALAKVPADRFSSADHLIAALEADLSTAPGSARPGVRPRVLLVGGLVAGGLIALILLGQLTPQPGLDANKVVVFPLVDASEQDRAAGIGEAIALAIGSALEQTDPLRWIYGWTWLDHSRRENPRLLSAADARRIARDRRARYFVDGATLRTGDSATVILRLYDAAADSLVAQVSAAGSVAATPMVHLGLRAVTQLLPSLVEPGHSVDLSALADRRPAAVSHWLEGEREHRRSRFAQALQHFQLALAEDSGLGFAAVKGALAASWLDRVDDAQAMVNLALRDAERLPPKQQPFARGLRFYLTGQADSAAAFFATALRVDPEWSDAWMLLGEAYYHLLPLRTLDSLALQRGNGAAAPSVDSLSGAAFLQARQFDPDYTPALVHLAEIALRRGEVRTAAQWVEEFTRVDPDTTQARQLQLMLECVREGTAGRDWLALAGGNPRAALWAAKSLSAGGGHGACVEAGFRAVLAAAGASAAQQWNALLGLHHSLMARRRVAEAEQLVDSAYAAGTRPARSLYLLDNAIYGVLERRALEVAGAYGVRYDTLDTWVLWLLGTWHASRRDTRAIGAIGDVLTRRAHVTTSRLDRLMADVLHAHRALFAGDTSEAVERLSALLPSASRSSIAWSLWEPLGYERLLLARLLLARQAPARADRVAAGFDYPQSIASLLYLPASLSLRLQAADALNDRTSAFRYRARLGALGWSDSLESVSSLVNPATPEARHAAEDAAKEETKIRRSTRSRDATSRRAGQEAPRHEAAQPAAAAAADESPPGGVQVARHGSVVPPRRRLHAARGVPLSARARRLAAAAL